MVAVSKTTNFRCGWPSPRPKIRIIKINPFSKKKKNRRVEKRALNLKKKYMYVLI